MPIYDEQVVASSTVESIPFVEEETVIPAFSLDAPLPASALDGYVLDENEVFDAITQFDTTSIEAESDILEAVEVFSAPMAPVAFADEPAAQPVSEIQASIPTPIPSVPVPAPAAPIPSTPAPVKSKNTIKHGFDF